MEHAKFWLRGAYCMRNDDSRRSDTTPAGVADSTACRCAFYLAAPAQAGGAARPQHTHHRCMLAAGRVHGPDGKRIRPDECTPHRQLLCQAHRRDRLASLHLTETARRRAARSKPVADTRQI
jgi:hypothetical protein